MTRKEIERRIGQADRLMHLGFTLTEAEQLRRISQTLSRWSERECGTERGCINRDDVTGKPYWESSMSHARWPIRDLERGALRRLASILKRHPTLGYYHQTDPRGAALYLIRQGDIPPDADVSAYYNRGVVVY